MKRTLKIGSFLIIMHVLVAIISWALLDQKPAMIFNSIRVVTTVLLIMMWYEGMKIAGKEKLINTLVVSLFFTIPYIIFTIIGYNPLKYQTKDILNMVIWVIYNKPFLFREEYTNFNAMISTPFIVINTILIINLLEYKIKNKSINEFKSNSVRFDLKTDE